MTITGGANVFPAEAECALAEHHDSADFVVRLTGPRVDVGTDRRLYLVTPDLFHYFPDR